MLHSVVLQRAQHAMCMSTWLAQYAFYGMSICVSSTVRPALLRTFTQHQMRSCQCLFVDLWLHTSVLHSVTKQLMQCVAHGLLECPPIIVQGKQPILWDGEQNMALSTIKYPVTFPTASSCMLAGWLLNVYWGRLIASGAARALSRADNKKHAVKTQ